MKMTSSKRFAVRTALVTGTTLATIIGAQALASLDAAAYSQTPEALVAPAEISRQAPAFAVTAHAPGTAPDIVILRHGGQVASTTSSVPQASNSQPVVILPPNPVQVIVPQAVQQSSAPQVVQQPSAPQVARTRSSR